MRHEHNRPPRRACTGLVLVLTAPRLHRPAPRSRRAARPAQPRIGDDPRPLHHDLDHSSATSSYGWPVKPFHRQHPVRAFLNDPRIGRNGGTAFHFGIDVSAPDGTAVYAVEAGTVYFDSPARDRGRRARPLAQLRLLAHRPGRQEPPVRRPAPAARLHRQGLGARPLRRAARRHLRQPAARRRPRPVRRPDRARRSTPISLVGTDLVANAHDTPDPRVPGAWAAEPVTPGAPPAGARRRAWRTAVDFRARMLPTAREFGQVYTPTTLQNHKGEPGCFSFYLARDWHPRRARHASRSRRATCPATAPSRPCVHARGVSPRRTVELARGALDSIARPEDDLPAWRLPGHDPAAAVPEIVAVPALRHPGGDRAAEGSAQAGDEHAGVGVSLAGRAVELTLFVRGDAPDHGRSVPPRTSSARPATLTLWPRAPRPSRRSRHRSRSPVDARSRRHRRAARSRYESTMISRSGCSSGWCEASVATPKPE